MTFLEMIEAAECSPDFQAPPGEDDAVWLSGRLLQRAGLVVSPIEVRQSMIDWAARPRGAEHHVRSFRL